VYLKHNSFVFEFCFLWKQINLKNLIQTIYSLRNPSMLAKSNNLHADFNLWLAKMYEINF
jgi:hypothetical protein